MAVMDIVRYPDERLKIECDPIDSFTAEFVEFAAHFIETAESGPSAVGQGNKYVSRVSLDEYVDSEKATTILINPDISLAAGDGVLNDADSWGKLTVPIDVLQEIAGIKPRDSLRIVSISGDSGKGVFNHGDLVLIDTAINEITGDGVYAFVKDGTALIKQLDVRLDGAIVVKSPNPEYDDYILNSKDNIDFNVVGKFIGVWNWQPK